jgi:hypothetical protein
MPSQGGGGVVVLGFRTRTGYASAVALSGPRDSASVIVHREIELHDARMPESRFPYHAALELSAREAKLSLDRSTRAARAVAVASVREFVEGVRARGLSIRGAAIVSLSDTDPVRIANPHMRAHAAEGQLFPDLVEFALAELHISARRVLERDLPALASDSGISPAASKRELARLGREAGRPWRAAEKSAALAAMSMLGARVS